MMRLKMIFAVLFLLAGTLAWADDLDETNTTTIVIEHVGVSDRFIIPVIISTSDVGIKKGRARVLESTRIEMMSTHVATKATMMKFLAAIHATPSDGTEQLKLFGTLRFSVLRSGSTQEATIILGRTQAITLLKSLESSCPGGPLRKDLAYLRYQVKAVGHGPNGSN